MSFGMKLNKQILRLHRYRDQIQRRSGCHAYKLIKIKMNDRRAEVFRTPKFSSRPNMPNSQKLIQAIRRHSPLEVEAVLNVGADMSKCLALYEAVVAEDIEICRLLISRGANVNQINKGYPTIFFAVLSRNLELCRFLLDSGADSSAKSKYHTTPLHEICLQSIRRPELSDLARLFLERGADPNARDCHGTVPLHLATDSGLRGLCELLLEDPRTDINARNRLGQTPLWIATHHGRIDFCRLLLNFGADPLIADYQGLFPLDVALNRKHQECVALFQDLEISADDVEFVPAY